MSLLAYQAKVRVAINSSVLVENRNQLDQSIFKSSSEISFLRVEAICFAIYRKLISYIGQLKLERVTSLVADPPLCNSTIRQYQLILHSPLYIGLTFQPIRRFKSHAQRRPLNLLRFEESSSNNQKFKKQASKYITFSLHRPLGQFSL